MLATRMIEAAAGYNTPQVMFSDNFNRADNATTLGAAWTPVSGTWGISSNQAYNIDQTDGKIVLSTATMSRSNYQVTAKIPSVSSGESPGVIARAVDGSNFYLLHVQSGGSTLKLFATVSGSYGGIYSSPSGNFTPGDTIGIRCVGSSISVLHNGAVLTTLTDTHFAGPGKVGMRYGMASAPTFTARWDDFVVTSS